MLLILLSWIYLLSIAIIVGAQTCRIFKVQAIHPIINILFGCFSISLIIGFWAILSPINEGFYLGIFIVSIILFFINKTEILNQIKLIKNLFSGLNTFFKAFLILILILTLAKCASAPFITDNETYYLQTIKWLNHYGFTKGLTNLHLFLGQTSGWHLLQSGFNFAFIYDKLNDISGLCLLLGNLYAIEKLNNYIQQTTKNRMDLIIGLFPVFNVFLFQFIGAPSPDIPIYILGMIIFYEFVNCYYTFNKHAFYAVFILAIFATFIKLTGLIYFLLALVLYFYYYIYTRKRTVKLLALGIITLLLFVIKNTIITGNYLYPLQIETLQTSWSLPIDISNYFSKYEKAASYGLTIENYNNASIPKKLYNWLTVGLLDGVFNSILLISFLVIPFIVKQWSFKKAFKTIYISGLCFFVFALFFTPQYRFYFAFIILFSLCIASLVVKHKKSIYLVLTISIMLTIIPLAIKFDTTLLANNTTHKNSSAFSFNYTIEPHANSKYTYDFKAVKVGNTKVNSITNGSGLIWETGDMPLPALNEKQLDYFKTYFNSVPQQYSKDLKDGFYTKNTTK